MKFPFETFTNPSGATANAQEYIKCSAQKSRPATNHRPATQRKPKRYFLRTVHTEAQRAPPTLKVAAAFGFFTCKPTGARPSNSL